MKLHKPAALLKGDRVRLVAPASPFDRDLFETGLRVIERLGFEPVVDRKEFSRTGFLAGNDAERARRLQQALLEPDTKAVWCIRGGYGTTRLLDKLDLKKIRSNPKLLIGFSDVTALLLALSTAGGFVTIHGPVVTQLSSLPKSARDWLYKTISSPVAGSIVPARNLKTVVKGKAEGVLLGGNLSLVTSLVGTPYLPSFAGSILFLEDTFEQAYRLDRMFNQLQQASVFEDIKGVVIGSLAGCLPAGRGQYNARNVVERAVAKLGLPAVSGADFGHIKHNFALPLGVKARLDATKRVLTILEPVVS
ncbi:MAG: LD-carboxypeptidase [Deltaproteobacteria bacterium]|nr:LD-carboxypeptidase [Deltaproteobacteria bacterium]MBW1873320.1 LD-carboxypeptidase [Deltaproteobacteria bacterium]